MSVTAISARPPPRAASKPSSPNRARTERLLAILINGWPRHRKNALARWLLYDVLGCSKFSVTKLNGTRVNLERVEGLAAGLPYRDLYADYKGIWFEDPI